VQKIGSTFNTRTVKTEIHEIFQVEYKHEQDKLCFQNVPMYLDSVGTQYENNEVHTPSSMWMSMMAATMLEYKYTNKINKES
jgi:hypothetical protein